MRREVSGDPADPAGTLRSHVVTLAEVIGERHIWRPAALHRAASYIGDVLAQAGYAPATLPFETDGVSVANVEGALDGCSHPRQIVVVGAHYDSVVGCPGANDNGTGVAAVLELARRFARRPRPRTIRFVLFVNEEPPFFQTAQMGSLVYARDAQRRGERISGMLSIETIGYFSDARGSQQYPPPLNLLYPDVGNFIGFVSNFGSAGLLRLARRAFKTATDFPLQTAAAPTSIPGVGWSDHWSFWAAGFRAMMVTDTAPYRYPWYHTAADTPDKIAFDRLARVVDGLEHVVHVLAGGDIRVGRT